MKIAIAKQPWYQDPDSFSEGYWKSEWGIPTLAERRSSLPPLTAAIKREVAEAESPPPKKAKVAGKRGRKRKLPVEPDNSLGTNFPIKCYAMEGGGGGGL